MKVQDWSADQQITLNLYHKLSSIHACRGSALKVRARTWPRVSPHRSAWRRAALWSDCAHTAWPNRSVSYHQSRHTYAIHKSLLATYKLLLGLIKHVRAIEHRGGTERGVTERGFGQREHVQLGGLARQLLVLLHRPDQHRVNRGGVRAYISV